VSIITKNEGCKTDKQETRGQKKKTKTEDIEDNTIVSLVLNDFDWL
jgi:hypothetical protein